MLLLLETMILLIPALWNKYDITLSSVIIPVAAVNCGTKHTKRYANVASHSL